MRYKTAAAILFAGTLAFFAPRPASASWSVSISYFHQELAPYGRWVSATAYGDVWCPTVAGGWQPYVDGEWAYTDYGWTWVSYDRFGGDPFHYGTWVWIDPYGWCWVPGTVWGPAWVTWAYTDSYIGWACLPPSFEITAGGYAGSPIAVAQTQYVFVPAPSFVGTRVSSVRVPVQQNGGILARASRTTRFSVSGGIVRASGPPPSLVQRATGKPLHRTRVSSQKLRTTTIASAGKASGGRFRIVAPAHERAAAVKKTESSNPNKVARRSAPSGKSMREAATRSSAASRRPARVAREKPFTGKKPAGAAKAVKASRNAPSAHGKPATSRLRTNREVRGRELTAPHGGAQRRSSSPTGPPAREIRRERAGSAPAPRALENRSENPPPPAKHERRAVPASPAVSRAHPAPPREAMAKSQKQPQAQPRPQGPPAGRKEKDRK